MTQDGPDQQWSGPFSSGGNASPQPPRSVRAASSLSRSVRRERIAWGRPFSTTVLDKLEPALKANGVGDGGMGEGKAARPNPITPFGSSSLELVEKRPSRTRSLGAGPSGLRLSTGSNLRSKQSGLEMGRWGGWGWSSPTPKPNHPVRFEQLRACREAPVENGLLRARPSRPRFSPNSNLRSKQTG